MKRSNTRFSLNFVTVLVLVALFNVLSGGKVFAAALTSFSDTMSSSKVSTSSSHRIKFTTPTGANQSSDTIVITFPSDFNFSSKTIGTLTFTHGASTGAETSETLAASPSASAWGAVFSGTQNRVLTLTAPSDGVGSAAIAASDRVIVTYDATNSTNPSSPGNYSIAVTGTFGDTGTTTVPILSDDQVSVTATVPQSLTFSISDNSIGFATLSTSAARYATGDGAGSASETEAHTLVAGTNAPTGYAITVQGPTLTSGSNSITEIGDTNTASSAGTEQFGIRLSASGGSGAVTAPYAAAGFAYNATSTAAQIASATGPSANTTYSVRYLANVASLTEAGEYSTSVTYVATANF